jgi:RNA polymerase sigma factor (sigma-70 family)
MLDPDLVKMALDTARGFSRRLPRSIQLADLEQAAVIGLLDGLRRSPDGTGPAWEWYLRCRIRGEIIDELRRQDWAGRRRSGRVVPRMQHLEDLGPGWEDFMPGNDVSAEETAINRLDAAKAWSAPLAARDIRIMRGCFQRNLRQKDVGAVERVSEARISQRVARSLDGMRCHLTGDDPPLRVPTATAVALWKRQVER